MPIRKLGKCAVVALAALLAALPLAAHEGKPPDPYDPQGSAGGTLTGKALTNKDWWPNQLDLETLRQNSLQTSPPGAEFDYAAAFKKLDLAAVKKDIEKEVRSKKSEVRGRIGAAGAISAAPALCLYSAFCLLYPVFLLATGYWLLATGY